MLIGVVSDTHIPARAKSLPLAAWRAISGCELLLHAGDVLDPAVLEEMSNVAPVRAVMGNGDGADLRSWGATDTMSMEVEGVRISMVHDSGASKGRAARLRKWFPEARVAVFGHSHLPVIEEAEGLLLLNPGSPTDRRRAPTFTVALLRAEAGTATAELIHLSR